MSTDREYLEEQSDVGTTVFLVEASLGFEDVGDSTETSNSKVLFVWSSTPFHSLQIYFDLITKPSSVLQKEDKVKKTLLNF